MKLKVTSGLMLTLLFIGMLMVAFNVQPVEADGTIYIKADGSVDPNTAPISTVDNVTYTFTGNIYDEIVVERDNIVVDGGGYTLQGAGSETGIGLLDRSNVTIKNMKIESFENGIWLLWSSSNTISGNNIARNSGDGIWLDGSSNNTISGNNITENDWEGIWLDESSNYNTISGNNIARNNLEGVALYESSNNIIYHNNFLDNAEPVYIYTELPNVWDNGYPSGGNYWSDYTGVDLYSGPYQNVTGSDEIGDTPYVIGVNNQDNHPLMKPLTKYFPPLRAGAEFVLLRIIVLVSLIVSTVAVSVVYAWMRVYVKRQEKQQIMHACKKGEIEKERSSFSSGSLVGGSEGGGFSKPDERSGGSALSSRSLVAKPREEKVSHGFRRLEVFSLRKPFVLRPRVESFSMKPLEGSYQKPKEENPSNSSSVAPFRSSGSSRPFVLAVIDLSRLRKKK